MKQLFIGLFVTIVGGVIVWALTKPDSYVPPIIPEAPTIQPKPNHSRMSISGNYLMDNENGRRIIITHIDNNKFRIEEPTYKWPWSGTATLDGGKLTGFGDFRDTQAYMNVEGVVRSDGSIEIKYKFTTTGTGKQTSRIDSHVWYPTK